MAGTLKGKFRPDHPEKYRGNPGNIIYRSSWERAFCKWCDRNDSVLCWQSEERRIRYYDPVAKKNRTYFPDFYVRYRNSKGTVIEEIIEVKPQKHIDGPPLTPKRRTRSWMDEVRRYATNQAKWMAAAEYCEDRGMNFRLLSEANTKEFL
tara:strand:+ start:16 stop:465 length:450 start_codon:yes stop_codon:yes gene_type:complete